YINTGDEIYYSPQIEFTTPQNTLNIEVSDDYVPEGYEYWLVLSDDDETLEIQKLENGKTYSFSDDLPDLTDIHILRLNYAYNRYYINISSYADITPDDFSLESTSATGTTLGQSVITVSDIANFLDWGVSSTNWSSQTTSPTKKSFTVNLTKDPDNIFINYIPSDGSAPRYKYLTNVSSSSNYTFVMSDFTAMTNYAEVALPVNTRFYYFLNGYSSVYTEDNIRYHGHYYSSGLNGTFKLYYPVGIKPRFFLYTYYTIADKTSYYMKLGTQPAISFPDFPEITLSNTSTFASASSSINNYSGYEIMDIVGYFNNTGFSINWNYYKQPGSSNSAPVPDLPPDIIEKIGTFSTAQIPLTNVGYFDFIDGQIASYSDFINLVVQQSGNLMNLVTEYRIFSQSPSGKSALTYTDDVMNSF
ncbi:MAG: hypothetical protein MUE74_07165, partial [Bacteroidales bacterium]|nr:hypothetical protein [Bacteroidales bacterium]